MYIDKYKSIQILMHPHQWEHHGHTSTDKQFVFALHKISPTSYWFHWYDHVTTLQSSFSDSLDGNVYRLCFSSSAELQKEGGSVHYHQRLLMVSFILTYTYEKYHLSIPTQAISNLNHQGFLLKFCQDTDILQTPPRFGKNIAELLHNDFRFE